MINTIYIYTKINNIFSLPKSPNFPLPKNIPLKFLQIHYKNCPTPPSNTKILSPKLVNHV